MADTDTRPGATQLRRSTTDKVLGGVAGGLGRYFGIDPVLVRIAFGLSIFVGGVGVVVYLVMWLLMPRDDRPDDQPFRMDANATTIVGIVLLVIAVIVIVPFGFGGVRRGRDRRTAHRWRHLPAVAAAPPIATAEPARSAGRRVVARRSRSSGA